MMEFEDEKIQMKEFNVNEYITLKLENDNTEIYLDGKKFMQCKSLIIKIPENEIKAYNQVDSIDEASEFYNHFLEKQIIYKAPNIRFGPSGSRSRISPEAEFWAHCSNLQTWCEHDFDTRLLHTNLSFPLLEGLTKAGDLLAKMVFKNEISNRLSTNHTSVTNYLFNEGYVNFLSREELYFCILNLEEAEVLLNIEDVTQYKYFRAENAEHLRIVTQDEEERGHYVIQDKKIIGLDLNLDVGRFPKSIMKLKNLKILYLCIFNYIEKFPGEVLSLKSLEKLDIYFGELSEMGKFSETIIRLPNLRELRIISDVHLYTLPFSLENMKLKSSLKKLTISNNLLNKPIIRWINSLKFNKSTDYEAFSVYQK